MKKETDTFCKKKLGGTECRGALMRDHRISKMEVSMDHRKYTCDKCDVSYKFVTED
jgi:hypothetical protein